MPAQTQVAFAPPGHLLFVRDKTLMAQPFDPEGAEDHRRARAAGRAHRHRLGGAGQFFDVSRRHPRLSDGRSGQPAHVRRSKRRELETVGDPGE